jgi:hypothetical protein
MPEALELAALVAASQRVVPFRSLLKRGVVVTIDEFDCRSEM